MMTNTSFLRNLDKDNLLRDFSALIEKDRRDTATLLAYIAEVDRRKLYLEHACPSMFAFCTKCFHMSEAVAARRIRAGRATCRFPCILGMVARGELHLSGIHQLAGHLTDENYEEVLQRARHRSMREIERLIAEISPKPDVPTSIRALPIRETENHLPVATASASAPSGQPSRTFPTSAKQTPRAVPNRCSSTWLVEFHHRIPYARGGTHDIDNIELRCRAHNQYEAELGYGVRFMETQRHSASGRARTG